MLLRALCMNTSILMMERCLSMIAPWDKYSQGWRPRSSGESAAYVRFLAIYSGRSDEIVPCKRDSHAHDTYCP